MKNKTRKILCAAENPGSFNAIFPVVRRLREMDDINVVLILSGAAKKLAREFDFIDVTDNTKKKVQDMFQDHSFTQVLLGASEGMSVEKHCIKEAKKRRVPTIAVIDFWSNYTARFSTPDTADLAYITDTICVADEYMKDEMIKAGFPERLIAVTGNPFFETFTPISTTSKFILFVSQPFSELYDPTPFDEVIIFKKIVELLTRLQVKLPIKIALHPRSRKRDKYNSLIKNSSLTIEIAIDPIDRLLPKTALVVGINSVVLFQSALLGLPVISYQPGILPKDDTLMSNRLGLSLPVYDERDLIGAFRFVTEDWRPSADWKAMRKTYTESGATDNIIHLLTYRI